MLCYAAYHGTNPPAMLRVANVEYILMFSECTTFDLITNFGLGSKNSAFVRQGERIPTPSS